MATSYLFSWREVGGFELECDWTIVLNVHLHQSTKFTPYFYVVVIRYIPVHTAKETAPLMASGLCMEERSLRNSWYMGSDCSDVRALWKSGLLPFST